MKTAIGYTRVSTTGQASDGFSLPMQENKIRAYCDLNDLDLVDVIVDAGISGKNLTGRPGVQQLISLIKTRKTDSVIVYKLDRLGRSTRDLIEIAELLKKKRVALHSVTEKLDTSTPHGKFFFTLTGAMAEMERDMISDRVKSGMAEKKSQGGRITRHAPYGYQFTPDGKLIENLQEKRIVKRIRQLNSNGFSIRAIEQKLFDEGILNRSSKKLTGTQIWRILQQAA